MAADIQFVVDCADQASRAAQLIVFQEKFGEMQQQIRSDGPESLSNGYAQMYKILTQGDVVIGLQAYSEAIDEAVVPGVTTMSELADSVGLRETARFAGWTTESWRDEVSAVDVSFGTGPTLECYSLRPEAMQLLCDRGDLDACVRIDLVPERDLSQVALACEQAPYLIFCDPEDPPPWDPPEDG